MAGSSSTRRRAVALPTAVCVAAAMLLASEPAAAELRVTAAPVLGSTTPANGTWLEIGVRIDNDETRPLRGTVELTAPAGYGSDDRLVSTAPFAVGAGATATVRMPTRGAPAGAGQMTLRVLGERGDQLSVLPVTTGGEALPFLLDTSEPPRLAGVARDLAVPISYDPGRYSWSGSSRNPGLVTGSVRTDPATGDPVLPERAAGYASATLVVMRSDQLARLAGLQLEALANYVLAGGSLAVFLTRPEDLRNATLSALVGGEVSNAPVPAELKRAPAETPEWASGTPGAASGSGGSGGSGGKKPRAGASKQVWPGEEVGKTLTGYAGGNLVPTLFGAAATYGLGEIHLLAFDPTASPGVDDPWVKGRMIELVAHAWDRRESIVARHGASVSTTDLTPVRKELDPNEGSRWAIIVAAILLTAYAVVAGPVNFLRAARKQRPLRALVHMPIYAAIALGLVVLLGIGAKGWSGKSRHLTFVEAGAGVSKASVRRFRGFFTSRSRALEVRATDSASVLDTAIEPRAGASRSLIVEREGLRLVGVSTMPWETIVLREDGFTPIGAGLSVTRDADGEIVVANRTARDLRAVVLVTPSEPGKRARGAVFFDRLRDGARVKSSEGKKIPAFSPWSTGSPGLGSGELQPLRDDLEAQSRGLFNAWIALASSFGDDADWWPQDVPVVLAQIDGGEGRLSDSGLGLDRDRVLMRVVGWGGLP